MMRTYGKGSPRRDRGVILPILAIGLLTIIGIAGMAIDLGHGFTNKSRLQNALDAAALSGARTLMQSRDVVRSGDDATIAFTKHLEGEMSGLDIANLTLQFSDTLDPFVPGGANPLFIRAAYGGFQMDYTFAAVIPGLGTSMDIGGTAVAGPIPVGTGENTTVCDLAPVMMCATDNGDTDCSDGACYGYTVEDETGPIEFQLKTGSGGNGGGNSDPDPDPSGNCPGNGFYGCQTHIGEDGEVEGIGPGNFQLARLDCEQGGGGSCVRQSLAGSHHSCLANSDTAETEPGNTVGPTRQGLNTLFNIYSGGGLNSTDYPPDIVTTDRIVNRDYWYANYKADSESIIAAGTGNGVPYRRVVAVPVVECNDESNGQSTLPVLDIACFFLTRKIANNGGQESYIYGQLVDECETSGQVGVDPGPLTDWGPKKVVLYNDPDSPDS